MLDKGARMLIGARLPGEVWDRFRFVEDDLHHVAARVREYDRDARLVVEDDTMRLCLARWVPEFGALAGGAWAVACYLPLHGEPDARVLHEQRARDVSRWRRPGDYRKLMYAGHIAAEQRRREADRDRTTRPMAERLAWSWGRKDRGVRNFAAIPRGV